MQEQNFNYHTHTYRCGHADMIEDEKYVQEAIKIGLKELAFTDHAPMKSGIDARPEMRMRYDQKEEYLASIRALKEKYKDQIDIKVGFEVEYLPGLVADIKELKDESDIIILGQHFIYDDYGKLKHLWGEPRIKTEKESDLPNEEQVVEQTLSVEDKIERRPLDDQDLIRYAGCIEEACKHHLVDIIAHPDLFMLSSKQYYGGTNVIISSLICESSIKYKIPVELNLNRIAYIAMKNGYDVNDTTNTTWLCDVEYPNKSFWEIAAAYGVPVVWGIDAHHEGQIENFKALQSLAEKKLGDKIIDRLNFVKKEKVFDHNEESDKKKEDEGR